MKRTLLIALAATLLATTPANADTTHRAHRTIMVTPGHPNTVNIGLVPEWSNPACTIRVDLRVVEQSPVGTMYAWAVTPSVAVEIVLQRRRGPITIRAASFAGRHRIFVSCWWTV